MIAIAVISIGVLGAISAIAYGLRASDRGARGTFALTCNQRMMEMILNGHPYQVCAPAGVLAAGPGQAYPDADTGGVFNQNQNSNLWHTLYYTADSTDPCYAYQQAGQNHSPFVLNDFVSNAAEQPGFAMNATQYQCNINIQWLATMSPATTPANTALQDMIVISVYTRWCDKSGWKCISTQNWIQGTKS